MNAREFVDMVMGRVEEAADKGNREEAIRLLSIAIDALDDARVKLMVEEVNSEV